MPPHTRVMAASTAAELNIGFTADPLLSSASVRARWRDSAAAARSSAVELTVPGPYPPMDLEMPLSETMMTSSNTGQRVADTVTPRDTVPIAAPSAPVRLHDTTPEKPVVA